MSFTIEVLRNDIPKVPVKAEAAAAKVCNSSIMRVIAYADPMTPVDKGLLKGNKDITLASPGSLTSIVRWVQHYALFQDKGTIHNPPTLFATTGAERSKPQAIAEFKAIGAELA